MCKMCNCEASFLDEPTKMREIPLLTHMGNKKVKLIEKADLLSNQAEIPKKRNLRQ